MDNQGFIVHMMPEENVLKCLNTKTPEVHIHLPKQMNYPDLIRLLVPRNLQDYYYIDPYLAKKNGEVVPPFDASEAKPIPEYSKQILCNYFNTLSNDEYVHCMKKIAMIHKEQWHYHRLTNIVKTLSDNTSIIMIKLLAMGVLHNFELSDFINLFGILFNRVELNDDTGSDEGKYYVPTFPDTIMQKLIKASEVYDLGVDFTKPIHRYFYDFCRKQIVYPEYVTHIQAMGELLYTFKLGVMTVCPKESAGFQEGFDAKLDAKSSDKFVTLLQQADREFLAARASRSI
jgi:hypothetical protein